MRNQLAGKTEKGSQVQFLRLGHGDVRCCSVAGGSLPTWFILSTIPGPWERSLERYQGQAIGGFVCLDGYRLPPVYKMEAPENFKENPSSLFSENYSNSIAKVI